MKFKSALLALAFMLMTVSPVGATISEQKISGINHSVAYPVVELGDIAVADRINADIQSIVDAFLKDFDAAQFYSGDLGYRIHLDDENFLSVTFAEVRKQPQPDVAPVRRDRGIVYYKKTGERLPLAFFVHLTPSDLDGEVVEGHLYNERGKNIMAAPEKSVTAIPENYFLGGKGYVCPIFQAGELTHESGPTYVLLDIAIIDYFNRKNK